MFILALSLDRPLVEGRWLLGRGLLDATQGLVTPWQNFTANNDFFDVQAQESLLMISEEAIKRLVLCRSGGLQR